MVASITAASRSVSLRSRFAELSGLRVVGCFDDDGPTKVASCGVSERLTAAGNESITSLVFRASILSLSIKDKSPSGDRLASLDSVSFARDAAMVGTEVTLDCARLSLSLRLYRSFSFSDFSKSLFKPRIIVRCFSTNRQSCALCEAACCFSERTLCKAASADPAAAIKLAASCSVSCDTRYALVPFGRGVVEAETDDIEDTVESIDAVR